ncbi:MAG: hypothetical protein ACOC7R_03925 [Planctomycetota bacterium]
MTEPNESQHANTEHDSTSTATNEHAGAVIQPASEEKPSTKVRGRRLRAAAMAVGIVLIAGAFLVLTIRANGGPDKVVKDLFKHLNAGDADAVDMLVLTPEMSPLQAKAAAALLKHAHGGGTDMDQVACDSAREKGGYDITILGVDRNGDAATVRVRLNLHWRFPPWETELHLVRQADQWFIERVPYTVAMTFMSFTLYGDMETRVLVGLPQDYPNSSPQ